MKKGTNNTFFRTIIIFLLPVSVQAQTGRIFGQVVDENSGDALPGASVFLKGTSLGAAADIHGNYYITIYLQVHIH